LSIASSADLSKSNLLSQSYANVYNLINTRTNVLDPLNATGNRKFVYRREPDVNDRGFKGYPFVIVHPVRIRTETKVLSGAKAVVRWDLIVEVRSSDYSTSKGAKAGEGAEHLDSISDDIMKTLNDTGNRTTLRSYGMSDLVIDESPVGVEISENEKVFSREFMVVFRKLVAIS